VIIVGDTPRDVDCGRTNGCTTFAVATGRFGVEELRAAGADHVVADLGDPRPLLAVVDALTASADPRGAGACGVEES
jgi:phosphoglycolate phosphatase